MARKAEETSAVDTDEEVARPDNKPARYLDDDGDEDADLDDEDSASEENESDDSVEIPPPPVFKPGMSSKLYFSCSEKVFG